MNSTMRFPKSVLSLLVYIFLLPGFFIFSAFIYNPFDIQGYYTFGKMNFAFHIVILTCIQLLVLTAIRVPVHIALHGRPFSKQNYGLLCTGEIFAVSCFMALYTELFKHNPGGWFQSLAACMQFTYLTMCYPALFFYLIHIIKGKDEEILAAGAAGADDSLVRFFDEHKRLKLTIASSSILYIQSQANYVIIHYLDSDRTKEFQLRCSMKSIEDPVSKHGLKRCHRSFFVNPTHVRVLRKDTDGIIYADLDTAGVPSVPVSKQYYDSLASIL